MKITLLAYMPLVNRLAVDTSPGEPISPTQVSISTKIKRVGAKTLHAVDVVRNPVKQGNNTTNIMTIYQIQIILTIHSNENLSRKAIALLTQ